MKGGYKQAKGYITYSFVMLPFIFFSCVMILQVFPYLSLENGIRFLSTKSQNTLDNNLFRLGFYVHITSSMVVLLAGLPQFMPGLTRQYPRFHKASGLIYVIVILGLAAPSGLILAIFANGGLASQAGFSLQCLVWWCCTFMAFNKIRQKNYRDHIAWMIRSYAVTLAAMSLRSEAYLMHFFFHTKPIETYITVTWLSWTGNLFIAEALIALGLDKFLLKKYTQNSLT